MISPSGKLSDVLCFIHEGGDVSRIGQTDLEYPTAVHWCGVHKAWAGDDPLVNFNDLALERRINLRSGLNRFHHRNDGARLNSFSGRREFDEHKIAELFLRVIGDADRRNLALETKPFVIFGKLQHKIVPM